MPDKDSFDFSQLNDSSGNHAGDASRRKASKKITRSKGKHGKRKRPIGLLVFMALMMIGTFSGLMVLLQQLSSKEPLEVANSTQPAVANEEVRNGSVGLPIPLVEPSSQSQESVAEVEEIPSESAPKDLSLASGLKEMPFADSSDNTSAISPVTPEEPSVGRSLGGDIIKHDDPDEIGKDTILELYRDRSLFKEAQYTLLRSIFADRFAKQNAKDIGEALGDDNEAAKKWFDEHAEIRDELFTAIDPELDNVIEAIRIFDSLRKKYPEQIVSYLPLAIATSVVWDNKKGVYRYEGHSRRTHSQMPDGLMEAADNFEYFLIAENVMQGRGQFLPWEFLVHVVNHPTPMEERKWAVLQYLPKRIMFGKCYGEVPYDGVMLETGGQVCRLEGKPYTLANLRSFGGVCSMQADFATRVGKSLGVPAAHVSGGGRFGGSGHAWVMWVEIKSASLQGIQFVLESHGRYRGDHYYVGNLIEPQSGQRITDRQLELRLQSVGMNPWAKRRADWLMDLFSMIRESEELDVLDQIRYLSQVLKVSPLNEGAWRTLAKMSRDGVIEPRHEKLMLATMNGLFSSFASFPDFTWEIFDDLIHFQQLAAKRDALYSQLVALYEHAGRPDLSCKARLRYSDYLVGQEKVPAAITGLAFTILKFPQEGRYVPSMLDRMEQLAGDVEGANQEVLSFYRRFLPLIDQKRGNAASDYCMEMYKRGIDRFEQAGDAGTAMMLKNELAKLRG
ncbi:hypothetical protein CA13_59710 [Planctomycetes bacterium CA13]|uniref:Uncharacterized protein n=1 Tax=Novipirellula herctigrandis TaxID=2527986 RepID=A0A5C5ZB21_9BACT|nr:hypothetical protein CA13_59710 [Planctomycetes bacterium CA13]